MTKKSITPNHDATEAVDRYDLPPDFDPYVPSREEILTCLRNSQKPLTIEQLAEQLRIAIPLSVGAERRLAAMQRDGQLRINAK